MRLLIKICGIRDAAAARAAVAAGADLLGFVFHAASPRHTSPAAAAEIAAQLPEAVGTVAVMLHPAQSQVDEVCRLLHPGWLQTDAEDFSALHLPAGCRPLPVLRRGVAAHAALPARLLYDSAHSGAGERADWQTAAQLARRTEMILAGGLDAGNVANAIGEVRPFGVDVSSGVESRPGVKDPRRIAAFIAAARRAAACNGAQA